MGHLLTGGGGATGSGPVAAPRACRCASNDEIAQPVTINILNPVCELGDAVQFLFPVGLGR